MKPREALARTLENARRDGRRVVFTNGCFDLLHVGHVRLLEAARALGDILVVGINSDASVRRLDKGSERPLVGEAQRAEVVGALACVDYVTIFDEDTPIETILALKPQVHVKGGDYDAETIPETPAVRSVGGVVRILPLIPGFSTTRLVERLKK
ncbi:MAG: D-glycero-beta-D-manno-heptose 1-phosphate adenylyltransferase [Armatimonadetes bacterium]|nr:D-glycero-beta-D-manno-heptose 1-phosphate adenylyltransferase [Armatimonadota bacterium]